MMKTRFLRRTALQPSHNLFTDERVFIPRTCVVGCRAELRVRGCHCDCDCSFVELQTSVLNGLLEGEEEIVDERVEGMRERMNMRRVQRARGNIL